MSNKREKLNSTYKNKYSLKIQEYINGTDSIKEIISKKKEIFSSFDLKLSPRDFNKEKLIKTSNNVKFKETIKKIKSELFTQIKNEEKNKITPKIKIFNHPLSSEIIPCKVISLNKRNGTRNHLIIDINNIKKFNARHNKIRRCLSLENNIKNENKKLKIREELFNNIKGKSPLDLLVEKKERAYDIKFHTNRMSNKDILEKFYKKNFKNERDNIFLNKYFYIKSKLKIIKKSKKKFKSLDKALNFDENKYKLFQNISKKLKQRIKISSKKLDVKKILQKIKTEENLQNRERISKLKNDIEDEKILLTPKNFMRYKQDPFASYKMNKFVQALNSELTYRNRFILSKKFGIQLDNFLLKTERNEKKKIKTENV